MPWSIAKVWPRGSATVFCRQPGLGDAEGSIIAPAGGFLLRKRQLGLWSGTKQPDRTKNPRPSKNLSGKILCADLLNRTLERKSVKIPLTKDMIEGNFPPDLTTEPTGGTIETFHTAWSDVFDVGIQKFPVVLHQRVGSCRLGVCTAFHHRTWRLFIE